MPSHRQLTAHQIEIMGRNQEAAPGLRGEMLAAEHQQVGGLEGVEPGERFIQHEHARLGDQHRTQGKALALFKAVQWREHVLNLERRRF